MYTRNWLMILLLLISCKQEEIDPNLLQLENSKLKTRLKGSWIYSENTDELQKVVLVTFSSNSMLFYDSTALKNDSSQFESASVNEGKLSIIYSSKQGQAEESLYLCPEFEGYNDILSYDLDDDWEVNIRNYQIQENSIIMESEIESEDFFSPIPKSYVTFQADTVFFSFPSGFSCGSVGEVFFREFN